MDTGDRVNVHSFFEEDGFTHHIVESVPRKWFENHFGNGELEEPQAGAAKDWHNTDGQSHGQVILEGGFTVIVGAPGDEQEVHLGVGARAIFRDDTGRGHASRIDANDLGGGVGCRRLHSRSEVVIP